MITIYGPQGRPFFRRFTLITRHPRYTLMTPLDFIQRSEISALCVPSFRALGIIDHPWLTTQE
jgi:hypothetical protein